MPLARHVSKNPYIYIYMYDVCVCGWWRLESQVYILCYNASDKFMPIYSFQCIFSQLYWVRTLWLFACIWYSKIYYEKKTYYSLYDIGKSISKLTGDMNSTLLKCMQSVYSPSEEGGSTMLFAGFLIFPFHLAIIIWLLPY